MDVTALIDRAVPQLAASRAMTALKRRKNDFDSELEMKLTAVAMDPAARTLFEQVMDSFWNIEGNQVRSQHPEIVIGGGLHAAIYCAVRVQMGHPKPLIIERGRVGGCFAMSKRPSFWLNSRNRPGPSGLPGEARGLNHVPGAVVQVANLSASEFTPNSDLAYVIRTSIGVHGQVKRALAVNVLASGSSAWPLQVTTSNSETYFTKRVIDARGLGDHESAKACDGKLIMTSEQFMAKADEDFPLHELGRVAIIGGGNSGLCVAESLLGLAPAPHMSVPRLDWVEQVDLYAKDLPYTCQDWRKVVRGRYQALGSALQPLENGRKRLRVFPPARLTRGYQMSFVNERPYDTVVLCTGWERPVLDGIPNDFAVVDVGAAPVIARQVAGAEVYFIGPAADIPFSDRESEAMSTGKIADNRIALFRLGNFTGSFAYAMK